MNRNKSSNLELRSGDKKPSALTGVWLILAAVTTLQTGCQSTDGLTNSPIADPSIANSAFPEVKTMKQDKADVLRFFKKLLIALGQDAFADPSKLENISGTHVLKWKDEGRSEAKIAENIKTGVAIFDSSESHERGLEISYIVSPTNKIRAYAFTVDNIFKVTCISRVEVESAIGSGGLLPPPHGANDWAGGYEYRLPAEQRMRRAYFEYSLSDRGNCLKTIYFVRELPRNPSN